MVLMVSLLPLTTFGQLKSQQEKPIETIKVIAGGYQLDIYEDKAILLMDNRRYNYIIDWFTGEIFDSKEDAITFFEEFLKNAKSNKDYYTFTGTNEEWNNMYPITAKKFLKKLKN